MLIVYSENITSRVEYIFKLIFVNILDVDVQLTEDKDEFLNSEWPKINYSKSRFDDEFLVYPNGLLFEQGILKQDIVVSKEDEITMFFKTDKLSSDISFDPFAASFFLVSRYEEYLPFKKDQFARFRAEESIAFINDFLDKPVVNQWAQLLKKLLLDKYPKLIFPERRYSYISTIDVDNAWAYLHKGFKRTVGAIARSFFKFDFNDNFRRFAALLGIKNDPFDTYAFLDCLHGKYNVSPVYFFLVGEYGAYDKNISVENRALRYLINDIDQKYDVGIHPSYASNSDDNKLASEIFNLSGILGGEVVKSRQHFLKLTFPDTYRNLLKNNISEDHTMGYPSQIGFRAGVCTPFNFYDLEKEEETGLIIYPFQVMDGALNNYMKLSPDEAILKIKQIVEVVKQVNGTFVSLWHNESVSGFREWKGWEGLYEEVLKIAKE